jgi:hypothetical protein
MSNPQLELYKIRADSRIQSRALQRVRSSGATTVPKKHTPDSSVSVNFGMAYIKPAPNDLCASQARQRARAGGATVPAKNRNTPTTANVTPIMTSLYNKPPVIRTVHHAFLA